MWDQISQTHKATGKIVILYVLVFVFFDNKLEDKKILHQMIAGILWLQSSFNCFVNGILICYGSSKLFELFHPFRVFIIYLYVVICLPTLLYLNQG
jgi:hypothetical protein